MRYYIGVDFGATNLRVSVVDTENGRILNQQKSPTHGREGQDRVIERMVVLIRETIQAGAIPPGEIPAIGIGVPGTPDIEAGTILFVPNLPGQWRGVPLAAILQERLDRPVALINDVRAMTLAEWIFGAGRDVDTLACFALGTGIGGGVVIHGEFHLGIRGTAGEFGHHVVEIDGLPCGCGGRGCLELYASGSAIAAMGVKEVIHGHTTRIGELAGYDLNRITADVVVKAAVEGDRIAGEILQSAGRYLGIAVSNVIGTISPQKVIFGGGLALAGSVLFDHVRQVVSERRNVLPVDQVEFLQAALGVDAGLVGAALWAKQFMNNGTTNRILRKDLSL